VKGQDDSYLSAERERLVAEYANGEVAFAPDIENIKAAKWRLALSLTVQVKMDSCILECELHALERAPPISWQTQGRCELLFSSAYPTVSTRVRPP
jgi:hypothetical protein